MNSRHSVLSHDRSVSQMVDLAGRHWEARREAASRQSDLPSHGAQALTIALSRQAGTLGTSVAEEVGKKLGWHVYDHDLLERIAQEMGVRTKLLESVDERQQSWLWESIEAFLSSPEKSEWEPYVSESAFVRNLVETVRALGVHGESIIVGRGACFILPEETTFRVRLVAPVKDRVANLSRTLNISPTEAAQRIRTLDRSRVEFVQDHFHKDPVDPQHYDLVLNAGRLSLAAKAKLIVEAFRGFQASLADKNEKVVTTS